MLRFQLVTYGVRRLRFTAKVSQGAALQSTLATLNTGPAVVQLRFPPGTFCTPALIVPPAGDTPRAPVGTILMPIVPGSLFRLNCPMKASKWGISYMTPPPALITVFPLPLKSHANPTRGAKLLWSPLYGELICFPT